MACALLSAMAGSAVAAQPPVWVVLEGLYAAPGGDSSRGAGAGFRAGYRVTDQLSAAAGFETLFARGGPVLGGAAGFEAMLDSTPIAPFLEFSLIRAGPASRAGFTLAQRTGFGADWKLSPSFAVGAVVRYFTALDPQGTLGSTGLSGLEFGLRLVLVPAAF